MIERCTAEQEAAGAIPGVANTRSLKTTEEEGATFAQKTALLLRGSIDNIQMVVPSPVGAAWNGAKLTLTYSQRHRNKDMKGSPHRVYHQEQVLNISWLL